MILALIGLAQLMVVLDATIVNIALPSAQEALGFSNDARQWVVTAYALSFGSLLLLGGRLGDLFGRKRVFVVGLAGFAVASALGGLAQSFGVLVAARALQGAFAALLAPAALGLLTTTFTDPGGAQPRVRRLRRDRRLRRGGRPDPRRRADASTWTGAGCMFVNLLLAVPAVDRRAAPAAAPRRRPATRPRIDLPGTLTASAGLFALVYGFSNAETHGWGAPLTIVALAAGARAAGRVRRDRAPRRAPAAAAARRRRPRPRRRRSSPSPSSAPGCSASSCS